MIRGVRAFIPSFGALKLRTGRRSFAVLTMKKGGSPGGSRNRGKSNLESKICEQCQRPMEWRKSWAKNWDSVKYCSDRCRRESKRRSQVPGTAHMGNESQCTSVSTLGSLYTMWPRSLREEGRERAGKSFSFSSVAGLTAAVVTTSGSAPASAIAKETETEALKDDAGTAAPGFFRRLDESADEDFYSEPRFVEHIDANAVAALTRYHERVLRDLATDLGGPVSVLDVCSSWVSHLGRDYGPGKSAHVVGVGMNEAELKRNPALNQYYVQNLNLDPQLKVAPGSSFDTALIQLSIDYLTRPVEVLQSIATLVRPGGKLFLSFSNRVFITKAVAGWTGASDDTHADICIELIQRAGAFDPNSIAVETLVRPGQRGKDPLFVVSASVRREGFLRDAVSI